MHKEQKSSWWGLAGVDEAAAGGEGCKDGQACPPSCAGLTSTSGGRDPSPASLRSHSKKIATSRSNLRSAEAPGHEGSMRCAACSALLPQLEVTESPTDSRAARASVKVSAMTQRPCGAQ